VAALADLLFGFKGRISRTHFWLGLAITVAAEFILMWLLDVPFAPDRMQEFSVRLVEAAIQIIVLYPTLAIAVKRLHDRDKPGSYALWLVGVTLVIALSNLLGVTGDPRNMSWLDFLLGLSAIVIVFAFLIDLGFRRGTEGDNRYGPDPLSPRRTADGPPR
jgi:uncharacterized membrane protein YhaH (DUF805 family)